jgi:8-oxo-dGTP pyrophosphatase MutT (NUDIX family)
MPSVQKLSARPDAMSLFADSLEQLLGLGLPGWEAQSLMVPPGRKEAAVAGLSKPEPPRRAAVLAIIRQISEGWYRLVFIKRPDYDGTHGGQIAFPGGKAEPGDSCLRDAAIRETFEEIGVPFKSLRMLGSLSPVYIPPSHFWVEPFLAFTTDRLEYIPDDREVDYILEIPLKRIISPESVVASAFKTANGLMKNYPCFCFGNQIVWGATAMITSEIRALLAKLPKDSVS